MHELVRLGVEAGKAFGAAQIQHGGVKTVNIYEPLAALISPSMSEEFSFSYLAELVAHLKSHGATVLLHICNDATRLLERMISTGADILSVDCQVDLAWGTADVVYADTCCCIERAALGGRYTVSSSCEVPIETPAENIDAMVRAAREFGATFLSLRETSH